MRGFYVFLVGVLVLFTGCKSTHSVVEATRQEWFGGAPGSGGGIKYTVTVDVPAKAQLEAEKAYVGSRETGFYMRCKKASPQPDGAKEGRQLFKIEFERRLPGEVSDGMANGSMQPHAAPEGLPPEFEGGALIFYRDKNGKAGQWVVQDFKRLNPLAYP